MKVMEKIWALLKPDGSILADSSFKSEADVWMIGLGWPDKAEIEDAKRRGYRAMRVDISIFA